MANFSRWVRLARVLLGGVMLGAGMMFVFAANALAQNAGAAPVAWAAVSNTAMGVTGDIQTAPGRLMLGRRTIPLEDAAVLSGADVRNAAKLFSTETTPGAKATLYRTSVPGTARFKANNTLCGSTAVLWVLELDRGQEMYLAFFSGSLRPQLDPETVSKSTALCGTYGYAKK